MAPRSPRPERDTGFRSFLVLGLTVSIFAAATASAARAAYVETKLVSDLTGVAKFLDPNLKNPWGISTSPSGPFWISDNGTGLSTVYETNGQPAPLVVSIPPPNASTPTAAPTGTVYNPTSGFVVHQGNMSGAALFLFATEDGTISGWSPGVNATEAIIGVNRSASGAVYKGMALVNTAKLTRLYVANFHAGTVEAFSNSFAPVKLGASAFVDHSLPKGYAPFNIFNLGGLLYVTYALQDAAKHDDVPGPGHGYINVFNTNGALVRRFASAGALNSPWGLAVAPASFGTFAHALLVGNFGDGKINAFNASTRVHLGAVSGANGKPIVNLGLWGLFFGNGGAGGNTNTLYFTAGIPGTGHIEDHGLFGSLIWR